MIPQRIRIVGFLSYQHEQEVDFGSASLWMLSGSNGSGKSSVFDGVTFAIFGHHRGGAQNYVELINKESNAATVEFDFKLDHKMYRIKRTLRRGTKGTATGTQQLSEQLSDGTWEPIPDTSKKGDFDKWIEEHIGLNYETFTSSVLLLQGKAEKLLDAKPSGRAEVLAGIVNLERYQKLHEKANARKLTAKHRLDAMGHQLDAVPEVTDLEYATAVLAVEAGDDDRKEVLSRIDGLVSLELLATRRVDADKRLADAKRRFAAVQAILHDAGKIETDDRRRLELVAVLPAVKTVIMSRTDEDTSLKKVERYQQELDQTRTRQATADAERAKLHQQRDAHQKQIQADETRLHQLTVALRELSTLVEQVKQLEGTEADLQQLVAEQSQFPPTLEADYAETTKTLERLQQSQRDLPTLTRIAQERQALLVATSDEAKIKTQLDATEERGKKLKDQLLQLEVQLKQAHAERSEAEQRLAVARAQHATAQQSLHDVAELAGKPTCLACGQELTVAHLHAERTKREEQLRNATVERTRAEETLTKVNMVHQELTVHFTELTKQRDEARELYLHQKAQRTEALSTIKRLRASLEVLPDALSIDEQAKLSESYPSAERLQEMQREVAGHENLKRQQKQQQEALLRFNQLRSKHELLTANLRRIRATLAKQDPVAVRRDFVSQSAEEVAVKKALVAIKQALAQSQLQLDNLAAEHHTCVQRLADLNGRINTELMNQKHCKDAATRAQEQLPDVWKLAVREAKLADYSKWNAELEHFIADGVEERAKNLLQARSNQEALRDEMRVLEREAKQFPPEAASSPEEIRLQIAATRKLANEKDDALLIARKAKADLDQRREQRAKLVADMAAIEGEFHQYKMVAELLGRDRLQRFLVRQAERHIVDYANAVLDRLSGGQLFLRLVGGDDGAAVDRALDLEACNRTAGGAAINVAFLSGSQKFRVAVSLALGIGQYAGKQQRPIESVIIDEGFGCLDRAGRQVMIQELQNLRGHLHCILLVSHQEEFADAFPDGYRFELENGSTKVRRFQR